MVLLFLALLQLPMTRDIDTMGHWPVSATYSFLAVSSSTSTAAQAVRYLLIRIPLMRAKSASLLMALKQQI